MRRYAWQTVAIIDELKIQNRFFFPHKKRKVLGEKGISIWDTKLRWLSFPILWYPLSKCLEQNTWLQWKSKVGSSNQKKGSSNIHSLSRYLSKIPLWSGKSCIIITTNKIKIFYVLINKQCFHSNTCHPSKEM